MALTAAQEKAIAGPMVAPGPGQVSPITAAERRLGVHLPGRRTGTGAAGPRGGGVRTGRVTGALRGRAGRPDAPAPPRDLEPAVPARAMDNMLGRLRFSEWM